MAPRVGTIPSKVVSQSVPFPTWIDGLALAANVAESYTVPSTVDYVIISADTGIWVNTNGTAAVATDITDGSCSGYVPASMQVVVESGNVISVLATATSHVSFWGYKR